MSAQSGELLLVTINHETVPMEERERYALDEPQIRALYKSLHARNGIEESLILNTCNRFELYAKTVGVPNSESAVIDALGTFYKTDADSLRDHAQIHGGQDAIRHLIEVSAGLKSQITGEAEIFGQVKSAYAMCQNLGYAGALINRMTQKGFQAAKLIRHSTPIGEGQINISNVAVDLSLKIFGGLENAAALIIGTGEIGGKTAKAMRSRGAKQFGLASHTRERAEAAASEWGGEPLLVDELAEYIGKYDIVIASTETESPLLTRDALKAAHAQRKNRPLFLIDLGLPRNLDPRCEDLEDVYLYNLDDLARIAEDNLSERRAAIKSSEAIAAQKSESIWQVLVSRGLVSFL